jgi:hypothetical protein
MAIFRFWTSRFSPGRFVLARILGIHPCGIFFALSFACVRFSGQPVRVQGKRRLPFGPQMRMSNLWRKAAPRTGLPAAWPNQPASLGSRILRRRQLPKEAGEAPVPLSRPQLWRGSASPYCYNMPKKHFDKARGVFYLYFELLGCGAIFAATTSCLAVLRGQGKYTKVGLKVVLSNRKTSAENRLGFNDVRIHVLFFARPQCANSCSRTQVDVSLPSARARSSISLRSATVSRMRRVTDRLSASGFLGRPMTMFVKVSRAPPRRNIFFKSSCLPTLCGYNMYAPRQRSSKREVGHGRVLAYRMARHLW